MTHFASFDPDAARLPTIDFTIRPAREADAEPLALVEQRIRTDGTATSPEALHAAIADFEQLVLLAESNSAPLAYARVARLARNADPAPPGHYLSGVSVDPPWRRRGIAHALTAARLDWIWHRADSAWYFTNAQNTASLSLHEEFGFAEVMRGPSFQGITFSGDAGILLKLNRPPRRP